MFKKKEAVINDLHERFSRSATTILTNFTGLDVAAANELRQKLRESGAEFKVSKNTFLGKAVKGTRAEALLDYFSGPNAVVFGYEYPVAVAKVLVEFSEENPSIEIRAGILNEKFIDAAQIEALSKLPSREILIAKMLSALVAVPTGLVVALSGVSRKLLYLLKAIEDQKR